MHLYSSSAATVHLNRSAVVIEVIGGGVVVAPGYAES